MPTLEQQLADAIKAQNDLTQAVALYKSQIDQSVAAQKAAYDSWKAGAKAGYPGLNLFNNAALSQVNSDGSPKCLSYWAARVSWKAEVIQEVAAGWWTQPGRYVRFTATVTDSSALPYGSVWTGVQGIKGENQPDILTTRGFTYRVVEATGSPCLMIGWETGSAGLGLNKDWTAANLTTQGRQTNALLSVHFDAIPPVGSRIVFDLKNIFINTGESTAFTLGINELTDVRV